MKVNVDWTALGFAAGGIALILAGSSWWGGFLIVVAMLKAL